LKSWPVGFLAGSLKPSRRSHDSFHFGQAGFRRLQRRQLVIFLVEQLEREHHLAMVVGERAQDLLERRDAVARPDAVGILDAVAGGLAA